MGRPLGSKNKKITEGLSAKSADSVKPIKEGTLAYKVLKHIKDYGYINVEEAKRVYDMNTFGQVMDYIVNDLNYPIRKSIHYTKDGRQWIYDYSFEDPSQRVVVKGAGDSKYKETTTSPINEVDYTTPAMEVIDWSELTEIPKHRKGRPVGCTSSNSTKSSILNYFKTNKIIDLKKAVDEFGWTRLPQYVSEFRKDGLNIKSTYINDSLNYVYEGGNTSPKPSVTKSKKESAKKPELKKIYSSMKETIIQHLEEYGSITSIQARDLYNCLNLSHIIKTLRESGYNIEASKIRKFKSQNTKVDRVQSASVYTLKKTKTQYEIEVDANDLYKFLVPEFDKIHETYYGANSTAETFSTIVVNSLNLITSSENVDFFVNPSCVIYGEKHSARYTIYRRTKVKKLFKTKTTTEKVIEFVVSAVEVDEG